MGNVGLTSKRDTYDVGKSKDAAASNEGQIKPVVSYSSVEVTDY